MKALFLKSKLSLNIPYYIMIKKPDETLFRLFNFKYFHIDKIIVK